MSGQFPQLIERDAELAGIADRLAAAGGGKGSLVLISGEAGAAILDKLQVSSRRAAAGMAAELGLLPP